jgi:hypothetical protein
LIRRWSTIGAPAGHLADLVGDRVRCSCDWSARASSLDAGRAAHARHVELVALLGGRS